MNDSSKLSDQDRQELFAIYKLHVELADRVSQRREGANRIFVSLLVGLTLFLSVSVRFGIHDIPTAIVVHGIGAVGTALSLSWFIVIRSYRQLNSGKFKVLNEIEERLVFPFYKREWELLDEGRNSHRYWKLTVVETGLPIVFLLLSVAVLVVPLF